MRLQDKTNIARLILSRCRGIEALRGYLIDNLIVFRRLGLFAKLAGKPAMLMCLCSSLLFNVPAYAFDQQEGAGPSGTRNALTTFRFGFSAYKSGRKDEAFKAYSDAAKDGHIGARWKLAKMYASGDGVEENDFEAFQILRGIVKEGAEQGSRDSSFVADALVSIGSYVQRGIEGSPVKADPAAARDIYWQAAANFKDADAQFELGKMFLSGEGGEVDQRQAGRWFNLSASKGHAGSQAMLGKMMFDAGKTTEGIGLMTAALNNAEEADRGWIRSMQEEAFAVSSEADRRTGISYGASLTGN